MSLLFAWSLADGERPDLRGADLWYFMQWNQLVHIELDRTSMHNFCEIRRTVFPPNVAYEFRARPRSFRRDQKYPQSRS